MWGTTLGLMTLQLNVTHKSWVDSLVIMDTVIISAVNKVRNNMGMRHNNPNKCSMMN